MGRFDTRSNRIKNIKVEATVRITNTDCGERAVYSCFSNTMKQIQVGSIRRFKESSEKISAKAYSKLMIPSSICVTSTSNRWMTTEKFKGSREFVGKIKMMCIGC